MSLTLGADIVKATDVIWVLGVLFMPDLALEKQGFNYVLLAEDF